LLLAVFEDASAARAGGMILRDLHADGSLTLYAMAIIARRPRDAALYVPDPMARGAVAAAPTVGAAIGAFVTLLGGPLTVASRTVTSGLVGALRDLDEAGFDAAFLGRISHHFRAGNGAVIAEVEEAQQLTLDARILAQGGPVFRHRLLRTLTEERAIRELTSLRCELRRLWMEAGSDLHAEAEARIRQERVLEFQQLVERTNALARALRSEAAVKVGVLSAQAARLEGAARQSVEQRATSVRSNLEARAARLDRFVEQGRAAALRLRAGGKAGIGSDEC
jgi:hypothetical protein